MKADAKNSLEFIVVGAGSAGSVVAGRLAEQLPNPGSVAVVEAGSLSVGPTRTGLVRRPADYVKSFGGGDDWALQTVPQPGLGNRQLNFPRGRGLGGSTRINASIWLSPRPDCLRKIVEASDGQISQWELEQAVGTVQQRVQPERPRWMSAGGERFLQAAVNAGFQPMAYERMNRQGIRTLASDDFLPPECGIRWFGHCLVDQIIFDLDRALGVRLVDAKSGTDRGELIARRGVILCAGAIESPAILQRSGIGPQARLRKMGIDCRVDLRSVGEGLQDHLIFPLSFRVPLEGRFPVQWSPRELARWQSGCGGPVASNLAEAGLFANTAEGLIQLHYTPTDYLRHPSPASKSAITIGVTVSDPRSRGSVRIVSPNPLDQPAIDPAYLADPQDLDCMKTGIELAKKIANQPPLAGWIGEPMLTGTNLERLIRRLSLTLYHPCGGCVMGDVVDSNFRVHGCENIYVIDASILPMVPSANPNPLVMALAMVATKPKSISDLMLR